MNDGEGTGIAGLSGATVSVADTPEATRERRGPNETAMLVLFFIVSLTCVGVLLWREENRLLDDPVAKAQRGEIVGAEGDSLVRAANFSRALQEIDGKLGSGDVVNSLRLSPVRVDVTARDDTGKQTIYSVDPAFKVSTRDFGESDQPGIRLRVIDTAAPERFFATVQGRTQATAKHLDYLVYSFSGSGPPSWLLYLDDVAIRDKQWEADSHGGDLRHQGQPSAREARQQACLQRARSAEDAARCQRG